VVDNGPSSPLGPQTQPPPSQCHLELAAAETGAGAAKEEGRRRLLHSCRGAKRSLGEVREVRLLPMKCWTGMDLNSLSLMISSLGAGGSC
jgi:hypothetical protein